MSNPLNYRRRQLDRIRRGDYGPTEAEIEVARVLKSFNEGGPTPVVRNRNPEDMLAYGILSFSVACAAAALMMIHP